MKFYPVTEDDLDEMNRYSARAQVLFIQGVMFMGTFAAIAYGITRGSSGVWWWAAGSMLVVSVVSLSVAVASQMRLDRLKEDICRRPRCDVEYRDGRVTVRSGDHK